LYYAYSAEGVIFASEIKALLGLGIGPAPEIDCDSVAEYLAFRSVLEPRTMFRGIFQLPSGHFMTIGSGSRGVEIKRYWSETEELSAERQGFGDPGEFAERFATAVRLRLVSDVPLGSFNSGGVDSSLVTREVRRQRSGELHTFSVGFEESGYDETKYSLEVAKTLKTTHHAEHVSPEEYVSLLPAAIWHNDEPLCHPHSVHLMHLSGVAKEAVTVVLTGEGADELFFGYPRLHIPRIFALLGPLSSMVAPASQRIARRLGLRRLMKLNEAFGSGVDVIIDSHRFTPIADLASLSKDLDYFGSRAETLKKVSSSQPYIEYLLEYERSSYLKSLLLRLDKMTMAHGLEARTPFLDYELVLWSKRLRAREKIGMGLRTKRLLKAEAAKHFSSTLVYRRKVGFGVPLAEWFRTQPEFLQLLNNLQVSNSFVASLVPLKGVKQLITEHTSGFHDHSEALWGLLNLEIWAAAMLHQPANCGKPHAA
jgi:asparagine synthase (glutamine-hydrolysing)